VIDFSPENGPKSAPGKFWLQYYHGPLGKNNESALGIGL
jgi:hypothetical protein